MKRAYNRHDLAGVKRCAKCEAIKPLDDFGPSRARAHLDGKQGWCRHCQREAARARHLENREVLLPRMRAYYAANRGAFADKNRRWQAEHPAEVLARAARRRAQFRSAVLEEVHPLVLLERDDGMCGICGETLDPLDFHVDHIVPIARGGLHSYANTQPAHPSCNKGKRDRLPEEFSA